jgi:hypothetical protein
MPAGRVELGAALRAAGRVRGHALAAAWAVRGVHDTENVRAAAGRVKRRLPRRYSTVRSARSKLATVCGPISTLAIRPSRSSTNELGSPDSR